MQTEIARLSLQYGIDPAIPTAIIFCESSNKPDALHKNGEWSLDRGWFQINDYYHESDMIKQGLNIKDKWDNLEYGFYLLKVKGTSPWVASMPCWSKKLSTVSLGVSSGQ